MQKTLFKISNLYSHKQFETSLLEIFMQTNCEVCVKNIWNYMRMRNYCTEIMKTVCIKIIWKYESEQCFENCQFPEKTACAHNQVKLFFLWKWCKLKSDLTVMVIGYYCYYRMVTKQTSICTKSEFDGVNTIRHLYKNHTTSSTVKISLKIFHRQCTLSFRDRREIIFWVCETLQKWKRGEKIE